MVSLNDGVRVRSGEIAFYILAGTMALIVAMQPWSLLAATFLSLRLLWRLSLRAKRKLLLVTISSHHSEKLGASPLAQRPSSPECEANRPHKGRGGFPIRKSLGFFWLTRDTSLWFFTEPSGVGFRLFLCFVDLLANLGDAFACRLYIDNKAVAIG